MSAIKINAKFVVKSDEDARRWLSGLATILGYELEFDLEFDDDDPELKAMLQS